MPNKLTLLKTQIHDEFLAAQRQDPVTARAFCAGDRITLCATCLLPFLEDSWHGMGGWHCGQSASVGLETEQASATEPSWNVSENQSHDANPKTNEEWSDEMTSKSDGLIPIPIRLHQIPITLRY